MVLYDRIGPGYVERRRADPRIAGAIEAALGNAATVVNVGAGAGSYEPDDRNVLAVEPSAKMRAQRPAGAAPCLDGRAEALPLADASFDAAMAIYTDFHWADPGAGIAELTRVSRDVVVVLTVDRAVAERFWLIRDYLPGGNQLFRDLSQLVAVFPGRCEVTPVPIPHDCTDGFIHAFWRRPRELLDDSLRSTMAVFDQLSQETVRVAIERLRADLESGVWRERNSALCDLEELDLGHRLVVWGDPARRADPSAPTLV